MPFGLAVSVLMHALLIGWALVRLVIIPPPHPPEETPVEVAIITPDALTRLKQGDRQAKELETQQADQPAKEPPQKETPKPKVQPAAVPPPPPPPPPEPEKPTPPAKDDIAEKLKEPPPKEAAPTPDDQLALEKKIEQEQKDQAERQRREDEAKRKEAEARKKAAEAAHKAALEKQRQAEIKRKHDEAKRKQFDADRMAALLNKLPDDKQAPAGNPTPPQAPTPKKGPSAGAPEGRDTQLTASEKSLLLGMIVSKVKQCWNINAGLEGAGGLIPVIAFELNRDGSVRGTPKVTNPSPSPQFQDAANNAIRAVLQCQNYALPAEKYEAWEYVTLRFDPSQMFR